MCESEPSVKKSNRSYQTGSGSTDQRLYTDLEALALFKVITNIPTRHVISIPTVQGRTEYVKEPFVYKHGLIIIWPRNGAAKMTGTRYSGFIDWGVALHKLHNS